MKRGSLNKVGQVLEVEKSELLKLKNFGEKSLNELFTKLEEFGFLNKEIEESDTIDNENSEVSIAGEV